jgi:hypothetical protein
MAEVEISHVVGSPLGSPIVENQDGTPLARDGRHGTALSGPNVEVVDQTARSLSDAARARAAAIASNRARNGAARTSAPAAAVETVTEAAPESKPAAAPAPANANAAPVDDAEDPDDPDLQPSATPAAAKPAETPPVEHAEVATLRATVERQTRMLEQARQQMEQATKAEGDAARKRHDLLSQAEEGYLEAPVAAARKWVAGVIGAADPNADEVNAEIDDLIADLISARNGVALDGAHQANRKAALLQRAWNKEKQRASSTNRETEDQKQRATREQQVRAAHEGISSRFESSKTKFPHLQLAAHLDGPTPNARIEGDGIAGKIFTVIKTGIELGTLDPNEPDDVLFEKGAQLAEKFYTARAEHLRGALSTGTAAPSPSPAQQAGAPSADVNVGKARQGHGSRALTNADASVAPAATGKPAEQTPKQETSAERRRRVIGKYFPGHAASKSR